MKYLLYKVLELLANIRSLRCIDFYYFIVFLHQSMKFYIIGINMQNVLFNFSLQAQIKSFKKRYLALLFKILISCLNFPKIVSFNKLIFIVFQKISICFDFKKIILIIFASCMNFAIIVYDTCSMKLTTFI